MFLLLLLLSIEREPSSAVGKKYLVLRSIAGRCLASRVDYAGSVGTEGGREEDPSASSNVLGVVDAYVQRTIRGCGPEPDQTIVIRHELVFASFKSKQGTITKLSKKQMI